METTTRKEQTMIIKSAMTYREHRHGHATVDGLLTLCGMNVWEVSSDFDKVLVANRCPYCHRDAAVLQLQDERGE